MTILEIKRAKKHCFTIVTDECEFLLDCDTVTEHCLKKGVRLSEEQAEGLKLHSDCVRALSKGSWLLSQRDYTVKGLKDKLKPDFSEYAVLYAVGSLEEVGALDDRRYAENAARYLAEYKSLSRKSIARELILKGVGADIAYQAAQELEYDQISAAARLIGSKYRNFSEDEKIKRRMVSALLRRGFSYSQINEAAERINGGTNGI